MRNIVVSVDERIYQIAEAKAARLGTSVSAMIKVFLAQMAEEETDSEQRKRLQRETLASIHAFSADDRLNRAQAHERNAPS